MTQTRSLSCVPKCVIRNALASLLRPMWVVLFALFVVVTVGACAHIPAKEPGATSTFDLVGPQNARSNLGAYAGQILVVELCASWSDPCLANSHSVSEACDVLCPRDDVSMVTVLLDEIVEEGLGAYAILELSQQVWAVGPKARAGGSALGPLTTIPRVLIFAKDGSLAVDHSAGIVLATDLIEAVMAQL